MDRLRIANDTEPNLRVNVDTGDLADFDPNTAGVQPDGDLNYAAGDDNARFKTGFDIVTTGGWIRLSPRSR